MRRIFCLTFGFLLFYQGSYAWQAAPGSEPAEQLPAATEAELSEARQLVRSMSVLPNLAGVQVTVRGATVVLSGEIPTVVDREKAEALVKATLGSRYIVNQLEVTAVAGESPSAAELQAQSDLELRQRLQQIFASIPALKDLTVEVSSGVVRLGGQALTIEASERAEALASKMSNVVFVDNGITVTQEVNRRLAPVIDNTVSKLRHLWISLPLFLIALIIVAIFVLLGKWATRWDRLFKLVENQPLVKGIVQQIVFLIFLLIGVILALDLLNARRLVTTLFGAAGIVGIALGFALKDIAENYLASLLLAMRRPFTADDYVEIGSFEGKVIRLNMRDTVLMTPNGNHLRLPNSLVFKSVIINYTRNPMRRFNFEVGVGCDEDLTQVKEICLQTLASIEGIVDDPKPFFMIKALGDSTVIVNVFAWVDQAEFSFSKVKSESIRLVKEALDSADIAMPAPAYVLEMQTQAAGEQPRQPKVKKPQQQSSDLRPDNELEKQIAKDRLDEDEPNLLEQPRS